METLDVKDRKILIALDTDATLTLNQIGKRVRLSKEVVAYRIKNLENKGIITNYITLSHFAKLGLTHFKLYIKYRNIPESKKKEIIKYLLTLSNLGWLASTEGIFDLMLSIRFQTIFEFENFKDELFRKYDKYFHRVEFAILTEAETKPRYYIYPPKNERKLFLHCNPSPPEKLDKEDRQVLEALKTSARSTLTQLSNKSKLSERIIQYRKKQLENSGVIVGYKLAIGYKQLGYSFFKCFISFNQMNPTRYTQLREYVRSHPNIIYWIKVMGSWDLELELEVPSIEEFYKITNKLRSDFSDVISTFEATLVSEEHLIAHS